MPSAPKLKSTPWTDYHAFRPDFPREGVPVHTLSHARRELAPEARFAMSCIERWGMVAARPAGEDTAGRQKLEVSTPAEVVARACEMSRRAFAAFEEHGWILDLPSMDDAVDAIQEAENANDG